MRRLALLAVPLVVFAPELQGEDTATENRPPLLRQWTGTLEFGQTLETGRTDRTEFTGHLRLDREGDPHTHRFIAEYIYGEQNGEKSSDRYGGSFRWRYQVGEHFYAQSLTSFETDRIRRVEERAEQNLRFGYRFLDTDRIAASVAPGATARYNRVIGVETGMNYLATLSQDVTWRINPAYSLEEDSTFQFDPEEPEDYNYRLNARLTGAVTETVSLSLRYTFIYENEVAAAVPRAEHRIITSLGYSF